jgi:hypothetical protein
MAASLKQRMDLFKKTLSSGEEADFKQKSGNTEQPDAVGKLSHSYLEKDDKATSTKRNFSVKKKETPEEKEKASKPGKIKNPFIEAEKKGKPMPSVVEAKPKRRSFGIFGKKKRESDASEASEEERRSFSTSPMDVMKSKAREMAGIRLDKSTAAPPPRKRLSILGRIGPKAQNNTMNAYNLVRDKSKADEVEGYLNQLHSFQGFKTMKRLSIRDNDIVQAMQKVIGNDPKQTTIKINGDVRFGHIKASLIQDFGDSIRQNLYLKSLTIRGVELGNTFLEALASAIRDNCSLEEIDLSRNHLTHDALVEFCQALEENHTVKVVFLQTQLSPLYEKGVEQVLTSLENNHSVKKMKIDFQSPDGSADKRLKEILQRNYWNKDHYEKPDPDDLLISFLKEDVVRAEQLFIQNELEKDLEEVREGDWDYLYELSVLFDKFKIQSELDDEAPGKRSSTQSFASPMHEMQSARTSGLGTAGKNPLTGAQGFPSDGSFLTEEFIDMYLKEDVEKGGLVFDFCNQIRLFKQFPATSPDRETIVNIFVYELMHHPRQHEFTGINMANTGCGNDFWVKIAEGVFEDPDLLPNLHLINAETNFITEKGIVAIASLIESDKHMRYIQAVKLDNQKALMSSKAERALARALCVNISVVRFSLRVRNLLERGQCNKYVVRNIDFLRQARRHHKISTGTLKERKRNEMEQLFDKIADNDESITEVIISANIKIKYTGMSDAEKVKSAKAFATNSHVTKVTMNTLGLGDDFATALGEALETNETIETLSIEGNAFSGSGFKGLFAGLGKNNSVLELRAKHQTKKMTSHEEQALPALLEPNTCITKISLDLRNSAVTMQLDKIGNRNRDHRRKSSNKTSVVSEESTEDAAEIAAAGDTPEVEEEPELDEEPDLAAVQEESEEEAEPELDEEPDLAAVQEESEEEAEPTEEPAEEEELVTAEEDAPEEEAGGEAEAEETPEPAE